MVVIFAIFFFLLGRAGQNISVIPTARCSLMPFSDPTLVGQESIPVEHQKNKARRVKSLWSNQVCKTILVLISWRFISTTSGWIAVNLSDIHCPQKINQTDFPKTQTFPLVSMEGNVFLCVKYLHNYRVVVYISRKTNFLFDCVFLAFALDQTRDFQPEDRHLHVNPKVNGKFFKLMFF